MLKGVNKRIVEVNDTSSIYFERAVFYLRPEAALIPDLMSQKEAERLYSAVIPHNSTQRRSMGKLILVIMAATASVIAFIRIS